MQSAQALFSEKEDRYNAFRPVCSGVQAFMRMPSSDMKKAILPYDQTFQYLSGRRLHPIRGTAVPLLKNHSENSNKTQT